MTKENNKNIYLYNDLSNLKLEESKSEHKKKENDIFKLLIENIKEYAIFMLDTNGYIITWNSGAKRLKYYSEDEIIGKHFSIFYTKEDIKNNKPEKKVKRCNRIW